MLRFNISHVIKTSSVALLLLALAGCGVIEARLAALPTTRVTTLPADQACDAPQENSTRLSGSYLRRSEVSGPSFVPVLVSGRDNQNGLTEEVTVNDQSQTRQVADIRGTTFEGSRDAVAKARPGFGPVDVLPNVYDVSYAARDARFSGPMVLGSGALNREIPTSGARLFSGRIDLDLTTQDENGVETQRKASGRFSLRAGYGSRRASLTASGFGVALPFATLQWSDLFLCGTRFVSSGKGIVTVQAEDGPPQPPFREGRETVPFRALLEATQFAPRARPAPPVSIGGVFVIQSDKGTLTGVFLSDPAAEVDNDV